MPYFFEFLHSQLFVIPEYPSHSFRDQTIIVTGSNVGLGFEAARHFVRLGAQRVILAVRDLEKGESAKEKIESYTSRQDVAEVWQLDLSSYESVKQFANRVESLPRLDAVIENAGITTAEFRQYEDNEATITINVVSTFLLALLVLPKLRETAVKFNTTPTLAIVSSEVHHWAKFEERKSPDIFAALNDKSKANMMDRYQVSKLIEVLAVREIAKSISGSSKAKVVINAVNPGFCYSQLTREAKWPIRFFLDYIMQPLLARNNECGSRALVAAAAAGQESHGEYMSDGVVRQASEYVRSKEGQNDGKRVWQQLLAKLEKIQPGILNNL